MGKLAEGRFPCRFGDFVLERRLASGGMADVFEARAAGPGGFERRVALKKLRPAYEAEGALVRAFVREARLGAMLRHRNVAAVHELGCVEGVWYFTLELVEGADLARVTERLRHHGVPFPLELALYVLVEVCAGLEHAHGRCDPAGRPLRIVHRDVSPQNVLVGREADVKLVDFGIARTALRRRHTDRGVIKGKYLYMSPEQARGERLDPRSDVYAAGVVLYELLTGTPPFADRRPEAVIAARAGPARVPPPHEVCARVPRDLSRVVMAALAPRPEDRPQRAAALGDALAEILHRRAPGFTAHRAAALFASLVGELGHAATSSRPPPLPLAPRRPARAETPTESAPAPSSLAPDETPTRWFGRRPGLARAPAAAARGDDDATVVVDTGLFGAMLGTETEPVEPPPRPPTGAPPRALLARFLGRGPRG